MTPQQYRSIGFHDGFDGRDSQYPKNYEYMSSFREGRRRLIAIKIKKIRSQYLWARQVKEKE